MYVNRNLKITVVEDNKAMSEMVRDYLATKFPSSEVTVYDTGEEALNGIITEQDVIVLDYHLDSENSKAMNGIQVLNKLKERYKTPVIFLSSQERADISANTIKYGGLRLHSKKMKLRLAAWRSSSAISSGIQT